MLIFNIHIWNIIIGYLSKKKQQQTQIQYIVLLKKSTFTILRIHPCYNRAKFKIHSSILLKIKVTIFAGKREQREREIDKQ